jgi:hypothetical protein
MTSKNVPAIVDEVVDAEIIEDDPNEDRREARELLRQRREASMRDGQIDNGRLWAGSPMYFYCKYCGQNTDVLPENYFLSTPRHICDECTSLIELGWHDGKMPSFPVSNRT